jgi:hypothetical protein
MAGHSRRTASNCSRPLQQRMPHKLELVRGSMSSPCIFPIRRCRRTLHLFVHVHLVPHTASANSSHRPSTHIHALNRYWQPVLRRYRANLPGRLYSGLKGKRRTEALSDLLSFGSGERRNRLGSSDSILHSHPPRHEISIAQARTGGKGKEARESKQRAEPR